MKGQPFIRDYKLVQNAVIKEYAFAKTFYEMKDYNIIHYNI